MIVYKNTEEVVCVAKKNSIILQEMEKIEEGRRVLKFLREIGAVRRATNEDRVVYEVPDAGLYLHVGMPNLFLPQILGDCICIDIKDTIETMPPRMGVFLIEIGKDRPSDITFDFDRSREEGLREHLKDLEQRLGRILGRTITHFDSRAFCEIFERQVTK